MEALALFSWVNDWLNGNAPHNIWFGVTVENQAMADKRSEVFKSIPAKRKFVSYEPAIEAVDWSGWEFINWLIIGGESGPLARPFDVEWARAGVKWCRKNGIAPFVKQLGRRPYQSPEHDGATGYDILLKHKSGADISEWDDDLRVQEFPN